MSQAGAADSENAAGIDGKTDAVDRARKRKYAGEPQFTTHGGVEFAEFYKAGRRASFCTECKDGDTVDRQWRALTCVQHAKRHRPAEPEDAQGAVPEHGAGVLPQADDAPIAIPVADPAVPQQLDNAPVAAAAALHEGQGAGHALPALAVVEGQPMAPVGDERVVPMRIAAPAAPADESERKHRGIRPNPQPFVVDAVIEV